MEFVKIVNNTAIYKTKKRIISKPISQEAKQILDYYNRIPANL